MCKWGVPSADKENHLSKSTTEKTKHNKIWETVSNVPVGNTFRSVVARAKQSKAWKTLSNLSVNDTLKSVAVQAKQSKALKITAGMAVGASAVAGTAVAGLKIFEDFLPESVKEYLPNWLKKNKLDQSREEKCPDNSYETMEDVSDTEMSGHITETVPEISDLDSQNERSADSYETMENDSDTVMSGDMTKTMPETSDEKCPLKSYKTMKNDSDTEMPGDIKKPTPNINNNRNVSQEKKPQSGKKSVKTITNKNNDEGHKEGIDWDRVIKNVEEAAITVLPPILAVGLAVGLFICGNPRLAKKAAKNLRRSYG